MKRVGEDVSEKLDYTPGVFTVERHVRGNWACAQCRTLVQAPVPAAVIDKGIPTAGLLAQVLVTKHADHVPLYRQEGIFGRAGLAIPRSTLAAWIGQCGARLRWACRPAIRPCAIAATDAPGCCLRSTSSLLNASSCLRRLVRPVVTRLSMMCTSPHVHTSMSPARSPDIAHRRGHRQDGP